MSATRKVVPITRKIAVASFSWAANTLTINTVAAHGLVSGDVMVFADQNFPQEISSAITFVDADTFTMATTVRTVVPPSTLYTNIFNATATGAQQSFTWGFGTFPSGLVQVNTNSTGTVTVKAQASLDNIYWVDVGTPASQALTGNGTVIFSAITVPYVYGRLNFTVAVGGVGGKVTAFKTVA